MKIIRSVARKTLRVNVVHLSPELNNLVWSRGIRSVPRRIRITMRLEPISSKSGIFKPTLSANSKLLPYYAVVDKCSTTGNVRERTTVTTAVS